MEFTLIIVAGIVLALVALYFVFRGFGALFLDYVVDGAMSFADELLGIGIAGLDVGDWIAAVIIFVNERKRTGNFVAGLAAWEATNFLPLSFIPGVGEVIEVITNFFPAVTILRMFFDREKIARKKEEEFKEYMELMEQLGIEGDVKKEHKKFRELMKKDNFVEAASKAKKLERMFKESFEGAARNMISQVNQQIQKFSGVKAEEDMAVLIEQGLGHAEQALSEAENFMENGNWKECFYSIQEAETLVEQTAEQYNSMASQ